MKIVINPSWKCQLRCPYCWLPHVKINRAAKEHSWREWEDALVRILPRQSIVDVCGGEPLLYPGIEHLLTCLGEHGLFWAVTTNALASESVEALTKVRPPRCAMINVSDHPGNVGADKNIERLQRAFPVAINRVDHPQAGRRNISISSLIPYQRYREGTELDGIKRWCHAGLNHWVADPGGDVFQCNVAMATAREPLGNLFKGRIVKPEMPYLCDWGCSSCYTSVPNAWLEDARPA